MKLIDYHSRIATLVGTQYKDAAISIFDQFVNDGADKTELDSQYQLLVKTHNLMRSI